MASLFHNSTTDDHIKTNRSEDRIITFQLIDEQAPKNSLGLADPRLFKGGNRLHAQRDGEGLWYLKYEMGAIPPALNQRWTHFSRCVTDVEDYYKQRNLSITRIEE
ncbi:MAG TPA: hypothetical protein VGJ00_04005 [Rhabdochlamydiaceae bacterium]|jgi:hypothetical protein